MRPSFTYFSYMKSTSTPIIHDKVSNIIGQHCSKVNLSKNKGSLASSYSLHRFMEMSPQNDLKLRFVNPRLILICKLESKRSWLYSALIRHDGFNRHIISNSTVATQSSLNSYVHLKTSDEVVRLPPRVVPLICKAIS